MILWYCSRAEPRGLGIDTCTIFLARPGVWMLAFCFRRKTDGKIERRAVGVEPNGEFNPKRFTWGLRRIEVGQWQVSPSIQCVDRVPDKESRAGYRDVETWHETPAISGVPEEEPWCCVGAFSCGSSEGKPRDGHIGAGRTIDASGSSA